MYSGEATIGLDVCAVSLGNNREFVSRSKFWNSPVLTLVFKSLSANDTPLPNFYRVTLDNSIEDFFLFHLGHLIAPEKAEQTKIYSHRLFT